MDDTQPFRFRQTGSVCPERLTRLAKARVEAMMRSFGIDTDM